MIGCRAGRSRFTSCRLMGALGGLTILCFMAGSAPAAGNANAEVFNTGAPAQSLDSVIHAQPTFDGSTAGSTTASELTTDQALVRQFTDNRPERGTRSTAHAVSPDKPSRGISPLVWAGLAVGVGAATLAGIALFLRIRASREQDPVPMHFGMPPAR